MEDGIREELRKIIRQSDNTDVRTLALAVLSTREEIKEVKELQEKQYKWLIMGFTILSIILTITTILIYLR